jgi:tRNA dimethylallyltransferase
MAHLKSPRHHATTSPEKSKIIFLVGPTAIGKTEAAVYVAKKLKAEIISCDSMQIYKGMDILTSKPKGSLLKKVSHHLISVIPASQEYNVSRYRKEAVKEVKLLIKHGKVPLFVGGTGLYVSILVDGIFEQKPNEKIRHKLYKIAKNKGSAYLYRKLAKIDPEAAAKIHQNDTKRLIRALEVYESTGKPISVLQKQRHGLKDKYEVKIFCLIIKRDKLYKRIDERVDKMFEQGLIREVKKLLGKRLSRTAACAIGVKELKGYFNNRYDLDEAKRLIKQNTRHYAKRQLTWFRKDKRIKCINIKENESPKKVGDRIWRELC